MKYIREHEKNGETFNAHQLAYALTTEELGKKVDPITIELLGIRKG